MNSDTRIPSLARRSQARLTSSKKRISTERERRRCSIQHQLDKSSAVEDQLMEIINGLKEMNDQLAEEVKCAKKDRRVALNL
jgi:hypothetical protein